MFCVVVVVVVVVVVSFETSAIDPLTWSQKNLFLFDTDGRIQSNLLFVFGWYDDVRIRRSETRHLSHEADRIDTRDTRGDTREYGSMFDLILARVGWAPIQSILY